MADKVAAQKAALEIVVGLLGGGLAQRVWGDDPPRVS